MSFIALPNDCSDLSPETALFGKNLRKARRSRGLTQVQLADILGVAQTNISRWESGIDQASPKCRGKLADIFFNHTGRLDRYVEQLALNDPEVTVLAIADNDLRYLHVSPISCRVRKAEKQDFLGHKISEFFDRSWITGVLDHVHLSDILRCDYSHDQHTKVDFVDLPNTRIYVTCFALQFQNSGPIMFTKTQFGAPTGQSPSTNKLITTSELCYR